MESHITKELLFAFFAGSCSSLQKRLIEKWLQEEANQELFYNWLCEWERKNPQYEIDVDAGLDRHREWVRNFQNRRSSPRMLVKKAPDFAPLYAKIAASAIILILAVSVLTGDHLLYKHYRTSFGEIKHITLDDDSKVTLNANSNLKVPRFFPYREVRRVNLTGEATFEVMRTADRKKFIIDTGDDTEVEVLGTVFNVYSRQAEKRVALAEGKVEFRYVAPSSEKKSIQLQPGELVTLAPTGQVNIRKTENPETHFGWKNNRFIFDSLTFRQVGKRIEEIFGTPVIIADSALARQAISGTFTASSAKDILDILKHGGEFGYYEDAGRFTITPQAPASEDQFTLPE